ncbi:MAG: class I SAM-dependent methyltransferase [Thermoleophilaceae bacterium]
MSVRDWDARTYERVSNPQLEWGLEVLDRLPLQGDERVLDAGCGSGRVTAKLLERLPRGHVVAVDASPSMVEQAREALDPARTTAFAVDLLELELDEPVDAVISTAVFHWILDHDRLFERLHTALKPGGRLEAQCGGAGNLDRFHGTTLFEVVAEEPYAAYFEGWQGPWNFSTPVSAAASLERAGFTDVQCWLERRDTRPPDPKSFVRTVVLGNHLDRLPEELRDPFVDAVLAKAPEPVELDYVRLNISAAKSSFS